MAGKPPPKKGQGQSGNVSPVNPLLKPAQKPAVPATGIPSSATGTPAPNPTPTPRPHQPMPTRIKSGGDIMAMFKEKKEKILEAKDKIEEKILMTPGLDKYTETPLFHAFIQKIVPKISLPPTSHAVIESFSNIDVTAERLSQVLKANPYYEYQFLRYIESISKREEMPSLEAAVILLGMQNSRNLILSIQMNRLVRGGHPEWTKEGKLKVSPGEVLKYALKTEETLAGRKNSYADTAYAGGMLFDIFAMVGNEIADDKKKFQGFLDTIYNNGLRAAQVAEEVAKIFPEFGFKKFIFAGALVHDIGKLAMALLDKTYISFNEDCAQKEVSIALRQHIEWKRFGISHAVLGSLCCSYFKLFALVEKAILYHHDPFQLRSRNKNLFQLTGLICLSSNISDHFKKTERKDDPITQIWKGTELTDITVDMRGVLAAVNRLA